MNPTLIKTTWVITFLPFLITLRPTREDQAPRWLRAQFYPNPVSGDATLDLSYDVRWIGKSISVINMQGQVVMRVVVNSRLVNIDTRSLKPGLYLLSAKKEDGDFISQKFVKQ